MECKKLIDINIKNGKVQLDKKATKLIDELKNKPGVWAMWGVANVDKTATAKCLEVAETKNMGKEILEDLNLMRIRNNESLEFNYNARRMFLFSKKFPVYKGESRRSAKYKDIAESYHDIYIEVIHVTDANNSVSRKEAELEFAVKNLALYWNAYGKQRRDARKTFNKILPNNILG